MSGIVLASVGLTYASAPVNTSLPVISGTVAAGNTLSVSTGTWAAQPAPTYTYQWQEGTTNISGATSSTLLLTLDYVGSTIRCIVTATNSEGSASATSASTSAVAVPAIGASIAGGYYAGQISTSGNGVATHFLIVAPESSGALYFPGDTWYYTNQYTPPSGTASRIDGPSNTAAQIADGGSDYPAATFCDGLTIGGYSDWYFPAIDELEICYYNLKPTTDTNTTSFGANNYSVPKRTSNYTTTVPGRTSVTAFRSGGSEAFDFDPTGYPESGYWSSTVDPTSGGGFANVTAYSLAFAAYSGTTAGTQYLAATFAYQPVRAVRRVAV